MTITNTINIAGNNIYLKILSVTDTPHVERYFQINAPILPPIAPLRSADFYHFDLICQRLEKAAIDTEQGNAFNLVSLRAKPISDRPMSLHPCRLRPFSDLLFRLFAG